MVEEGYYEDLIETWRKTHSQNDIFTTIQNESCYRKMKSLQDQVKAGLKKFKTDGEIIDAITKNKSCENLPGRGRRLVGTGSSRRVVHEESFGSDAITRDEIQHSDE
ncbi:hypothetical protein CTI12_AA066240 [Artemisia annua]|uniref:Uncharacterized protein n=1 Tax=Artemisia annua TaxID=35608 RepID=A0A2U1Q789_ARTAN|nr:hypothetical protein CTI12_AA066240 [Artemisia annua]